jgi:hypothetical protein
MRSPTRYLFGSALWLHFKNPELRFRSLVSALWLHLQNPELRFRYKNRGKNFREKQPRTSRVIFGHSQWLHLQPGKTFSIHIVIVVAVPSFTTLYPVACSASHFLDHD